MRPIISRIDLIIVCRPESTHRQAKSRETKKLSFVVDIPTLDIGRRVVSITKKWADEGMKTFTFRQSKPLWSLIGPSTPNAKPLNHQNVATIENAQIPKQIALVFVVYRLDEKMKWSRRCPSISTEKYSVGSLGGKH